MSFPGSPSRGLIAPSHDDSVPVRPVPKWMWAMLGIVILVLFVRAQKSYDDVRFWAYVTGCAHEGQWESIYDKTENPFAFHPYGNLSIVMLLYPLGYLPRPMMRVAIVATILLMWYILYRIMVAGVADRRYGFRGWVPLAAAGPLLGMMLAGRYLLNDLNLKQLNTITFTCGCLGMLLMLSRNRMALQTGGAALLAFSIGLKLTTLPLLAMLMIKRGWRQAAVVALMSFGILWLLPYLVLGGDLHARLSQMVEGNSLNMWLQIDDTTQTWSLANFLHYRIYVDPLWSELANLPPKAYQLLCVVITLLIGLPALRVMLRRRWQHTSPALLWEEMAMVGVAWALIDPDGRTAHYVTMVPAYGLIIYRRLEAWHQRAELPATWEWASFLLICVTNLWLVRLPEPAAHHFYMHYGLFSLGMLTLYAMTYREIRRVQRQTLTMSPPAKRQNRALPQAA